MIWTRRAFLGSSGGFLGGLLAGKGWSRARARKRILFLAGKRSHGFAEHEHPAGCRFLAERLNAVDGLEASVLVDRWPQDASALEKVDAVVFYGDGEGGHPMRGHEDLVARLALREVGLGFLHYALIPPSKEQYARMLEWIGGYYEPWWSVNPIWRARFDELPEHPVTRGVRPFEIEDEWYFHMRFREGLAGVRPLLTAVPPEATRTRAHGPHSGNPHVAKRKGLPEHLAWVSTRPGGGRGFGFTGGHWHWNWAHPDYRRFVLNAIVWLAGGEIPESGIASRQPGIEELLAPLGAPPAGFDAKAIETRLAEWRKREK